MYLIDQAENFGHQVALECDERSINYGPLLDQAQSLAADLIKDQDDLESARIVSLLSPSINYVVLQWAVWLAGGVFVPLTAKSSDEELGFLFDDIEPTIIVVDEEEKDRLSAISKRYEIKSVNDFNIVSENILPSVDSHRPCMLLYTSGTTGKPKGVVVTHSNLEAQIKSLQEAWGWSQKDKTVLTLPLYHVHGNVNILCCALASGSNCKIHSRFDPEAVWNEFRNGDLTLFMAVPTIYAKLMEWYDNVNSNEQMKLSKAVSNLRLTVSGSAPLSTSLFERWHEISGHTMLERYGMTETGMILSNPLNGARRKGAVGQPLPGVTVKLVDDKLQEVATGESGEVLVKGKNVFSEYWKRSKETDASFHQGWFRTGDLAVNEDGDYRLLGRLSQDIIKTGGHKVSALEIEEVLREHPDIKDASVVSIPDDMWGEIVCAAVTPQSDLLSDKRLLEWSKGYFISHKRPRRVLIMENFPRNSLGKVIKSELRKKFERSSEMESKDDT